MDVVLLFVMIVGLPADRRADRRFAGPVVDPVPAVVLRHLARRGGAGALSTPWPGTTRCWRSRSSSWPRRFMSTGGVAKRIIRFSIACVGHLQGGLAIAGVLACMMFAALSGSSPATVVAIGSIVIAAMRQAGYTKDFAAGVICNAGTLGILIPPSIVMVVYASATDVSVGRMFLAGVIPGPAGRLHADGRRSTSWPGSSNMPKGEWQGWGEVGRRFRDAFWGLMLIVIIMVGIYGIPGSLPGHLLAGDLHPDRGRRGRRGLCLPVAASSTATWGRWRKAGRAAAAALAQPQALVTAFFHRDTRGDAVRGGQADGHADVHHRQCADPQACADRRAGAAAHRQRDCWRRGWGRSRS